MTFVTKLDFLSGLGYHPARTRGAGPVYLISDLGQFDFANGQMRLISYHAGTTPEKIQKRTRFKLDIAPDLMETPAPSEDELHLLRNKIDPLNIRRLELLSGSARRQLLREILVQESI